MQRPDATADELISIAACAKQVGINKSTLSRQVKTGAVRSHGGKVRLSEVLADRASNIDLTQSRRRPKKSSPEREPTKTRPAAAPSAAPAPDEAAASDDGEDIILLDGRMVPFAVAQRIKENYLARQRQLDFERERGSLVERAAAEKAFFEMGRDIRDAWTSWPARVATLIAAELNVDQRAVAEVLTRHVQQHLAELGEPAPLELVAGSH